MHARIAGCPATHPPTQHEAAAAVGPACFRLAPPVCCPARTQQRLACPHRASAPPAQAAQSSSAPPALPASPPSPSAATESPAAWIAQLLKPDAPLILATLAAIILSAASSLCLPLAIGRTFDAVGAASGGVVSPDYQPAVAALFVTLAAAAVCNAVNFALAGVISQRAGTRLRTQLFAAVVAREQAYFDQARKVGRGWQACSSSSPWRTGRVVGMLVWVCARDGCVGWGWGGRARGPCALEPCMSTPALVAAAPTLPPASPLAG